MQNQVEQSRVGRSYLLRAQACGVWRSCGGGAGLAAFALVFARFGLAGVTVLLSVALMRLSTMRRR